jgi:monoamine oxidase
MSTPIKAGNLLYSLKKELVNLSVNLHPSSNYQIAKRFICRRSFLSNVTKLTAGAVAGGTALSSFHFVDTDSSFSTVGILGAGVAGLTAAVELKERGIDFSVFEASHQAGGRVVTIYDEIGKGIHTELGGEFIDSNHSDMFRLATKFGISLVDIQKEVSDLRLSRESYFFQGKFIAEPDIIKHFHLFAGAFLEDIRKLENGESDLFRNFDLMSISDYLGSKGVSGWFLNLLEAAFTAEYGLDANAQSALNFLTMIDAGPSNEVRLYGDSDERYVLQGGNQRLLKKMAGSLNERLHVNHFCKSISYDQGMYILEFSNGRVFRCRYLLVSIPFTALRKIKLNIQMSPEKRRVIDELHYGTNSKIVFGVTCPIWRLSGKSGYLFSDFIQNAWDSSISLRKSQLASYTIFQGGTLGRNLKAEQSTLYLNELNRLYPGFDAFFNKKRLISNWLDYPLTRGSYAVYRTGDWSTFAGLESERVDNLYFAGEHCSIDFRGYMNGAAETGRKAAESITCELQHMK